MDVSQSRHPPPSFKTFSYSQKGPQCSETSEMARGLFLLVVPLEIRDMAKAHTECCLCSGKKRLVLVLAVTGRTCWAFALCRRPARRQGREPDFVSSANIAKGSHGNCQLRDPILLQSCCSENQNKNQQIGPCWPLQNPA